MDAKGLIKQLVAIPSVTADTPSVNRASAFVADYLKAKGLHIKKERFGKAVIVYAATHAAKKSDLLLNAHIDVVSGEPKQFKVKEQGSRLFGRGVLDCKGHAAVIMTLLPRLVGKASVGAIFSIDEETGGASTRHMVKKGYAGKLSVVLDGNRDRIIIAQKGILQVSLMATGKAGHASAPWRCDNAIDRLFEGYGKIKKLFPRASETRSWRNTCTAAIVQGGHVGNQVPDRAEMVLNIRFIEKQSAQDILKRIRRASGLMVKYHFSSPFVAMPENHPLIKGFFKISDWK